jgi:uncharacterized membrane protein YhhN
MPYGSTILLAIICLGGAAGYVIASLKVFSARESLFAKALTKGIASTSFVVLAFINGAVSTPYGRVVLTALLLSWIGDLLLLSRQSIYLLSGMTAFLIAHVGFIAAFAMQGFSLVTVAVGLAGTGILAIWIIRWLWKHLLGVFMVAVPVYLIVIMLMVSVAIAASSNSLPLTVGLGAIFFAASDISVARDRFIERDVMNKAWGLPLYYLAQILFASSVAV